MCMSNYFLMYVIPSVMVQSYICYVTKPVAKVHILKVNCPNSVSYLPFYNQMFKGRWRKGNKGKVKDFDSPKAAKERQDV